MENKYVRTLIYVLVGALVFAVLLFLADAMNQAASASPFGSLEPLPRGPLPYWWAWVLIGAGVIYALYIFLPEPRMFLLNAREFGGIGAGAALYGGLTWVFTQLPAGVMLQDIQINLNPAIAVPALFGFLYGPTVGFFAGAFGYLLGNGIAGAGISPVWAIGHGLVGLIPGLAGGSLRDSRGDSRIMLYVAAAVAIAGAALPFVWRLVLDPAGSGGVVSVVNWAFVMMAALAALLVMAFAPRLWPVLLGVLIAGLIALGVLHLANPPAPFVQAGGNPWPNAILLWIAALALGLSAFRLYQQRDSFMGWFGDEELSALAAWSAAAVIGGFGFATLADSFFRGFNTQTALNAVLIPALGPALLFAVILTPLLVALWRQAQPSRAEATR
jgi:hypothetical protein